MIPAAKFLLIGILLATVSSFRVGDQFITLNTSTTDNSISVSLASNLVAPFTVYSPVLFDTEGSSVSFIPNEAERRFSVEPRFAEDSERLYNENANGEYSYAFKKSVNP